MFLVKFLFAQEISGDNFYICNFGYLVLPFIIIDKVSFRGFTAPT